MFSTSDTIVAIATPPGRGGIGVVRLSGPRALDLAQRLTARSHPFTPRHATFTNIRIDGPVGQTTINIDHAIVTYFPAPASYTGDDVVEISAHGSPVVLRAIVAAAVDAGARLAEPGEFTLRAYVNGRIDLMQAEAVADLIESVTPLQARTAFDQLNGTLTREIGAIDAALFDLIARLEASIDFPDEGYHFIDPGSVAHAIDAIVSRVRPLVDSAARGRLVREGLQVVIAGPPNVGKSRLFNALVGAERAIVTDIPGTTRDLVSETIDLRGLRVTLIDSAGVRETDDTIESEGVSRSRQAATVAALTLWVQDRSRPLTDQGHIFAEANIRRLIFVANKSDLQALWMRDDAVNVSAASGEGLDELVARMLDALDVDPLADRPEITNVRHGALVKRAHADLVRARDAVLAAGGSISEEFVLADLQSARAALEEVTGKRTPDDVLVHIFSRFCIGK